MIRFVLIIIFLFLFFTIGQISLLIGFLIGLFDKNKQLFFYRKVVLFCLNTILFLSGYRIIIKNKNLLDKYSNDNSPKLYISNHRSIFDIIISYCIINEPIIFVAKIELSKIPLFSIWVKNIKCVLIDRKDIRQSMNAIINCINHINNKNSIYICPEGTRNKSTDKYDVLKLKEGCFSIAKKTNCKIIPLVYYYENDVFENTFPFFKKQIVYVNVGESISIEDFKSDVKLLSEYTYNQLKHLLNNIFEI